MRLIDADSIPWLAEGVGEIPVLPEEEISSQSIMSNGKNKCPDFDLNPIDALGINTVGYIENRGRKGRKVND